MAKTVVRALADTAGRNLPSRMVFAVRGPMAGKILTLNGMDMTTMTFTLHGQRGRYVRGQWESAT